MNRTGQYLAEQRRARGLTPQQLAEVIGYRNVARGARRILELERQNFAFEDLIERVVRALDLDPAYVSSLAAADRRAYVAAWEQWASEPVDPELRFRAFATVWSRAPLPRGLSKDEAVAYASGRAVSTGLTHVLVWSRKEEAWCYPDGATGAGFAKPGDTPGPFAIFGDVRLLSDGRA